MRQRPNWNEYFINIAKVVATRSLDEETQVGSVITDANNRIISTGYNSFPAGCQDDDLPTTRPGKYPYMVHAEMNAIACCRTDLRGGKLFCTLLPCQDCAKAIATSGIKTVVAEQVYERGNTDLTLDFFKRCGISVIILKENDQCCTPQT